MSNIFKFSKQNLDQLPSYGFKIHVSATVHNYDKILDIVLPYLKINHIYYKYIYDKNEIFKNFSIMESASNSGKLITIYPINYNQFLKILDELYRIIPQSMDGIYIMSDRPYKDSATIFYRYGFFKEDINYKKDGVLTLAGPNGEMWQDYPKNYFDLPPWIEDIQEENLVLTSYLADNYQIDNILKASNGGNIYIGYSKSTNEPIVMKEARPNVIVYENIEKKILRDIEYHLSKKIKKYVPRPVEIVREWINMYYIYNYIEGELLANYIHPYTLFGYSVSDLNKNVIKFKTFLNIFSNIIDLIIYFHENDVVLHDIHSDNFIISRKGIPYFVDLENSYEYRTKPVAGIYNNISLKKWNTIDGKVADCHKFGNMILFCIARLHVKNGIQQELEILDNLLKFYGINSNIGLLIEYLFSNNSNIHVAKKILEEVFVEPYMLQLDFQKRIKYNLVRRNWNNRELSSNLLSYIYKYNESYKNYVELIENQGVLKNLIDNENCLGLNGLSGTLIILKDRFIDKEFIDYTINKVCSKLIDTNVGKMIEIKDNFASPYLNNGTAGFMSY